MSRLPVFGLACFILSVSRCAHGFAPTVPSLGSTRISLTPTVQMSPLTYTGSSSVATSRTQRQHRAQLQMAVSYESLRENLPSQKVIDAVESINSSNQQYVIASDVAAKAGVSLSQARKDLTALASLTQGNVAVSNDGELLYSFPPSIPSALSTQSAKYKAIQTFRKVWPTLFWLIRISFGVALLASVLAIFSTIFFLSSTSSSSDDNDNRRRSNGPGMRMGGGFYDPWWGPSPFDAFYYRPYGYYGAYGRRDSRPDEMGFLESVFSYIFGDGDPNGNLEERRLQLASNVIRENGGAVTAEQLAPFCDAEKDPSYEEGPNESAYVDESFVLPIVTALNGEPQVTEEGDIIYVFPELQVSAGTSAVVPDASKFQEDLLLKRAGLRPNASSGELKQLLNYNGISTWGVMERKELIGLLEKAMPPPTEAEEYEALQGDPSLLQEQEYKFSLAPDLNKFLAGGLGAINLGGALFLKNQLALYTAAGIKLPAIYGTVQTFYPLLLGYAVLFNAIPLARNFWIQRENEKIRKRNKTRRKWQTALAAAPGKIRRKLQSAAKFRTKLRRLGTGREDIVYDSSEPFEESALKKEQESLKEFDKLLGEQLDKDDNSGAFQ